jgi:iron(III) transport system permease protein
VGFQLLILHEIFYTSFFSIILAFSGAFFVMLASVFLIIISNYRSNNFQKVLIFLASCGYALPGTILAVGMVIFLGWINKYLIFI